jgi:hypothetical protein
MTKQIEVMVLLFDACKEEIQAGNRPNGNFTTTGWKNLIFKFAQKSGDNKKAIEEQVRYVQKGIYIIYGVQELCHWSWMG